MSKLKFESSGKSGQSTDGSYCFIEDEKLYKCSCSSREAVPDAKWWLDHHGIGKCFSIDQLNLLDEEVKKFDGNYVNGNAKATRENQLIEEYYTCHSQKDATFCPDRPLKRFYSHAKSDQDSWLQEFDSATDNDLRKAPTRKKTENIGFSDAIPMDLNPSNCLEFEQSKVLCSDLDSHLIGLKKIEPWWHAADTRDLTSLTSQIPSQFVKNCGLAEVLTMHEEKSSVNCINCFEQVNQEIANDETILSQVADCTIGIHASMEDTKGLCSAECTHGNLASTLVDKSMGELGLIDGLVQGSYGSLSSSDGPCTYTLDTTSGPVSGDLSRVELLEALCHSQTRAREAEKMAQEASGEREHVINLFFRQASYLFAYRQWLRMLQLEALCLQLRSKNQLSSLTSPALLRNNRRSVANKRHGKPRGHLSKYAVAFAVGLSLAGAGLLVGLTIGWLFPAF